MHRCLFTDEILRLFARELVESGARGTSTSLARCCGAITDPVLDELWATQCQLAPLLKCLPSALKVGKHRLDVGRLII